MKIFKFLAEKVQLFWFLKLVLVFDAKHYFKMYNAISYWTYISNKEKNNVKKVFNRRKSSFNCLQE